MDEPTMWNERQWRDRRIGLLDIVSSWAVVALIVAGLAAWAGVEALFTEFAAPPATRIGS
jgi:hypothetical protein